MTWLFTVAIFFLVIVITAVIFFGWIAVTVIGLLIRGTAALFAPGGMSPGLRGPMCGGRSFGRNGQFGPAQQPAAHTVRCSTRGCYAINPATARFCRRCGRGLPAAQQVQVRRAAVW